MAAYQASSHVCLYAPFAFSCRAPCSAYCITRVEVRRRLFEDLPRALTSSHRNFLMSLIQAEPKWELMSCSHLRELPAIKWKLLNIEGLRSSYSGKFEQQANELEARFEVL